MKKEKMFLTEHTEFTEKRWKAKNVVGFFYEQKNPTTIIPSSRSVFSVNPSKLGERARDIRRSSAFTLIELLLVIVLMAIVIGIATPAFIGMGRGAGMRGATRGVSSSLSLLRQWAITHREEVTFAYFAATSPTPSYYYATNVSGTAIISTNDPPQLPLEVMFVSNGLVRFKTDGGLPGSTPVEIYIRDRKFPTVEAKGKKIKINGLTGGIQVE